MLRVAGVEEVVVGHVDRQTLAVEVHDPGGLGGGLAVGGHGDRAAQVEREIIEEAHLVGHAGGVFLGRGVAFLQGDDAGERGDKHDGAHRHGAHGFEQGETGGAAVG